MKVKKIVFAISLEEETHRPLMQAREMDLALDSEIHMVHIVPIVLYARGMQFSVMTYPLESERPQIQEAILKKLTDLKQEIFPRHEKVIFKCLFDSNEKAAFTDYVDQQQADLVVISTRGKYGLKTIFDSSFAQHQLKYSQANLLILK